MLCIIQNDTDVPPGSITDHLAVPYRLYQPYRDGGLPLPADMDALIVLGGSMGANDDHFYPFLTGVKALIRTVVSSGTPYLGICLGGQLLATALGARLATGRWEEFGNLRVTLGTEGGLDQLFSGIPVDFGAFQWHHDSFDLPAGSVLLASSAACPHQAFRVGNRAWGLQFHPEITEDIIRCWAAQKSREPDFSDILVAGFRAGEGSYRATAYRLLVNFLAVANLS